MKKKNTCSKRDLPTRFGLKYMYILWLTSVRNRYTAEDKNRDSQSIINIAGQSHTKTTFFFAISNKKSGFFLSLLSFLFYLPFFQRTEVIFKFITRGTFFSTRLSFHHRQTKPAYARTARPNTSQIWSLQIRRLANFLFVFFKNVVRRTMRLRNCELFGREGSKWSVKTIKPE